MSGIHRECYRIENELCLYSYVRSKTLHTNLFRFTIYIRLIPHLPRYFTGILNKNSENSIAR